MKLPKSSVIDQEPDLQLISLDVRNLIRPEFEDESLLGTLLHLRTFTLAHVIRLSRGPWIGYRAKGEIDGGSKSVLNGHPGHGD